MVGSLFLTVALAWLSCCENPQTVDPTVPALYLVGNDVGDDNPVADIGSPDDEMCCDEPVVVASKPARCVSVEFRLSAPSNTSPRGLDPMCFSMPIRSRASWSALQNDPHTEVIAPQRWSL